MALPIKMPRDVTFLLHTSPLKSLERLFAAHRGTAFVHYLDGAENQAGQHVKTNVNGVRLTGSRYLALPWRHVMIGSMIIYTHVHVQTDAGQQIGAHE